MKYIFINPVVANMYIKEELDEWLLNNGYVRVEIKNDWHGIVKEKYNEVLNSTEKTLIDKRCPLAVDTINQYINDTNILLPEIDPILIHCGVELSNRDDLKGKQKIITTPCESLANYGNKKGGLTLLKLLFYFCQSFYNLIYYSCTKATISPLATMSPCFADTATMRPSTAGTISSMP